MRLLAALLLATLVAPASDARSAPAVRPPAFDGARALRDVERLVAIGPRPAGSPGAAQARQYIVAELKKAGLRARVEPFEVQTPHGRLSMANVVGVVPGRRPEVILVGGHYDTKWFSDIHFVGANDGGSSTALLLELARQLGRTTGEYTYWIAFFDGEEARETWTDRDSLYGSRRMATELRRAGRLPRAVLVVDMIGDRDLGIRREGFSTPWLTELVWGSATRLGHQAHFLADRLTVEDDHVPFLKAGVPAALLIDFDFPPWHTAADTPDKVSARSLQIVGEVVLDALPAVVARLARGDGAPRAR
ncbi:MAG TPA: M28 family peptidase [Methylomirabilota bacterium]|nr:M28 family peptidase [Methylomirabilota bacterium]